MANSTDVILVVVVVGPQSHRVHLDLDGLVLLLHGLVEVAPAGIPVQELVLVVGEATDAEDGHDEADQGPPFRHPVD